MSLNHIVLVGTVDRPAENRVSPEGVGSTTFKLKVLRPARPAAGDDGPDMAAPAAGRGDRFDFIPVLALRRLADAAAELRAGETVVVEGRLETYQLPGEQYKNGIRVVAETLARLAGGIPDEAANGSASHPEPAAVGAAAATEELPPDYDDTIPF